MFPGNRDSRAILGCSWRYFKWYTLERAVCMACFLKFRVPMNRFYEDMTRETAHFSGEYIPKPMKDAVHGPVVDDQHRCSNLEQLVVSFVKISGDENRKRNHATTITY